MASMSRRRTALVNSIRRMTRDNRTCTRSGRPAGAAGGSPMPRGNLLQCSLALLQVSPGCTDRLNLP